jgi:hypothetical protein
VFRYQSAVAAPPSSRGAKAGNAQHVLQALARFARSKSIRRWNRPRGSSRAAFQLTFAGGLPAAPLDRSAAHTCGCPVS